MLASTHLYRNFIGQAISGLPVTVLQLGLFLCLLFFLFRLSADAQGRVPGGRLPTGTTKSVFNQVCERRFPSKNQVRLT